MSKEAAIINVLNKKIAVDSTQTRAAESRRKWLVREADAVQAMENTVAFVLSTRQITESGLARALGCSRDKIRGMVKRANERNIALMRGETK